MFCAEVLLLYLLSRFRNISRILDCVTCEKCRLWSKLQVLGLGTAIRLLLTPEEDLVAVSRQEDEGRCSKLWSPSRQEVIALLNTLNQFATSIAFASTAADAAAAVRESGDDDDLNRKESSPPVAAHSPDEQTRVDAGPNLWNTSVVIVIFSICILYLYFSIKIRKLLSSLFASKVQ